jgi:photosystem II stability/assembly factor-like uncharacterized protein
MGEIFINSGENGDITSGPAPQLQGLFIPGIDNSQFVDGFGVVTPWGGGSTTRRYNDYGIRSDISIQSTQLSDLASSLIPAEGDGISFGLEGAQGIQGIPGRDGLPGIITVLGLNLPQNSNFVAALPHNIDLINDLGTAVDKLIYTDAYNSFGGGDPTGADLASGTIDGDALATYGSWTEQEITLIGWTERQPAGDTDDDWEQAASDSDGSNLIVASSLGRIYTSDDYGVTWTERDPKGTGGRGYWDAIDSDSDGSHLIAGDFGPGRLWTSADSGGSWAERRPSGNDLNYSWRGVASDSDGSNLIVTAGYNQLWTSADSGGSWTNRQPVADKSWVAVASDADGSHLIAAENTVGKVYTSNNSGSSWTERSPTGDVGDDWSVDSDSDGSHLIVAIKGGRLYTSDDSGATWTERQPAGDADKDWDALASDSDGSHLIAGITNGRIYTSTDFGVTWTEEQPAGDGDENWRAVASNSDGTRLVVGASTGRLYTGAGIDLTSGVDYAIIVRAPNIVGAAELYWSFRVDNPYANGDAYESSDSGGSWAISTNDDAWFKTKASGVEKEDGSFAEDAFNRSISAYGVNWTAQTFTTSSTYTISSVVLKLSQYLDFGGSVEDVTVSIRAVNPSLYSEATWAEAALTSAGRALLDDATAADQATTLGLGAGDSPTFTGLTLSGLTASRLVASGSALGSVADLTAWVAGTPNRVTVADDTDGTITISGPQDIHTAASPTFAGLTLSSIAAEGSDVDKFLVDSSGVIKFRTGAELLSDIGGISSDEKVGIDSGATAGFLGAASSDGVLRTGSSLSYSDGGDFVTIDAIQDIQTSASPTLVGLTLSSLTQGSIIFAGSGGVFSQDNSNFFWDDVNKRLKVKGDIVYHGTSYILSGMSEDRQDMFLTTSAGNVFFETEKIGGGDIEYLFDEIEYDLDCTTGSGTGGRAQVQLTEGSAINPQINYVYIILVDSTATLTASTSLPTGQFAWVALIVIQSDTEVAAADGGPLAYQRFTETYKHDSRGSLSHMREKIRYLGADYLGGMAQSLTITANGGADTVVLTTASGKVYQLHRQDWPVYDISSNGIWVANASGTGVLTKYQRLTDLNSILETSDGTEITNNKRFNLVIWGSINFTTGDCKMFVNLPIDVYQDNDQTISDENGTAVTTIPTEFQTTGFLIARLPLKYSSAGGGTWTNLMGGTSVIDLRGLPTGFNLGSGATVGSTATFSDADFEIFDNGDDTARLMFQVSGVSGGNTSTLTIPDVSGTLVTSANPEDLGGVLQDLNTLGAVGANSEFLVGTGAGALAWENAATAATSMGLGTGDSPQFTGIELGHASDTTLARVSAGVVAIEGTNIAMVGGAHHDGFSDFVGNEHIDHTGVTLTAGTGLTGGGDISSSRSFAVDGVLEDLDTLGAVGANSEFLVGTGIGTLAWENAAAARTSLGVGTGDSPAFAAVSLGTGELTAGSINRASGTLTLEIGGTPEVSVLADRAIINKALYITGSNSFMAFEAYSTANGTQAAHYIRKSSTSTIGTKQETEDGESLGFFGFQGVNSSSNFGFGVLIEAFQNGAAGATRVPTDLKFRTATSTGLNTNQLVLSTTGNVGVNDGVPGSKFDVGGDINTTDVYKVDDTQVVSNQGAAVIDATDAASVITQLNALLARCRTHGLIAT